MKYIRILLILNCLCLNASLSMSASAEMTSGSTIEEIETGFDVWCRVTSSDYSEGKTMEDELDAASARVEEEEGSVEDLVLLAVFDKSGPLMPRYKLADLILSKGKLEGVSFDSFGEDPAKIIAQVLSTTTGDESEGFFECLGVNRAGLINILNLDDKELTDGIEDQTWRQDHVYNYLKETL